MNSGLISRCNQNEACADYFSSCAGLTPEEDERLLSFGGTVKPTLFGQDTEGRGGKYFHGSLPPYTLGPA